jgi:hypothetical protein
MRSIPGPRLLESRAGIRLAMILSAIVLGVGVAILAGNGRMIHDQLGVDYALYLARTRSWLAGTGFYLPYQLAGPYDVEMGASLYPPVAILLFFPFLLLPAPLWWIVPMALVAYAVARLRPRPWTWPLMAICLAWPTTLAGLVYGNPTMWAAAFVAAGAVWRWPAALVVFKPTLLPFALIGVRSRAFWLVAGLVALASLAFLPMDLDYVSVVLNARGNLVYLLGALPMVVLPVIAWLGRTMPEPAPAVPESEGVSGDAHLTSPRPSAAR